VDIVLDPLLLRNSGSARNRTRTSGSVNRNSDHYTTEAVGCDNVTSLRIRTTKTFFTLTQKNNRYECRCILGYCHNILCESSLILSISIHSLCKAFAELSVARLLWGRHTGCARKSATPLFSHFSCVTM
jgi:hypothetical protein